MKILSKTLFTLYLLTLTWLVLFKFSADISSVLADHQTRSLNLVPFANYSRVNIHEMIYNFVVFVPFGLLLGVCAKRVGLWSKLAILSVFSLGAEIFQFVFAIGATDITDVIANTLGGLSGLLLYASAKRLVSAKILDWFIVAVGAVLLVSLILIRVLFLRVRY